MEWGLIFAIGGAAIATFLAGTGSAIGLGIAGRSCSGVLTEDPGKFGTLFLLAVLPSTQGFYGFVVTILILVKLGLLGGKPITPTFSQGLQIFCAALPVAVVGLTSGIHQGKVCAAGAQMAAKQPGDVMKPVIYAVMVETYAVLAFVVSLLIILIGIKL